VSINNIVSEINEEKKEKKYLLVLGRVEFDLVVMVMMMCGRSSSSPSFSFPTVII
jgi:hypothetical protein